MNPTDTDEDKAKEVDASEPDVSPPEGAKEITKEPEQKDKEKPKERIEESERSFDVESWKPRTRLGELVRKGEITSISDALNSGLPFKEIEIVNALLPDLQEEILSVGRVQRVTDSGRRMRFRVVTAIGNCNGYVGIGHAKAKEAGPAIRKAIDKAKLNLVEVKRGCGSWECGCGDPHTVPFKVTGNAGSVSIELIPAPRGVGLVSGEIPKKILSLAGISDVWIRTSGHTRTSMNFAYATYNALSNTNYVKVKDKDIEKLGIVSGSVK